MCFDRERLGDEHPVVVLELLLQAAEGDGLATADHAAQGNQVAFQDGALDGAHQLPVVLGLIVPGVAQRLREAIMLHDVNPHGLLLTVWRESSHGSARERGATSAQTSPEFSLRIWLGKPTLGRG
jgi:hypothetical protein